MNLRTILAAAAGIALASSAGCMGKISIGDMVIVDSPTFEEWMYPGMCPGHSSVFHSCGGDGCAEIGILRMYNPPKTWDEKIWVSIANKNLERIYEKYEKAGRNPIDGRKRQTQSPSR